MAKFKIDHDYHIHSKLSSCSGAREQTAENILRYAEKNGFNEICITDHFWDSDKVDCSIGWYAPQDFKHVSSILPLPQSENVRFRFGCETELDRNMTLGISPDTLDKFEFVIIPTTHLHMPGFDNVTTVSERAEIYVERLDKLLDMDLPFHKIGIAHLTCPLIAYNRNDPEEHIKIIDSIDDGTFRELFSKLRNKGAGFELNFTPAIYPPEPLERILRPYRIAKEVGCKFYLGSDAHHPKDLNGAMKRFEDMVNILDLEEIDRFYI